MDKNHLNLKVENIALLKVLDALEDNNTFGSFNWITHWSNTFKLPAGNLELYTIYSKNKLVAIAPFYIHQSENLFQLKTLYPLGQGEDEKSEVASEYNDIYILEGYEESVIKLLANKLKELNIDQIKWRATLKSSHINRLLKVAFDYQAPVTHARYLIETPTWSLNNLSKNTRSRYKRSINQFKNLEASFKWVEQDEYEHFSQILAQFHQSRWSSKGKKGAFSEHDFIEFHKNYRCANPSNIRISAIMVNEEPIAINYYLADKSTLYFYQCGWDETNYANLSPGFALHIWSIEHCKLTYYDFMMGGLNDSYKAKFGCQAIPMINNNIKLSKVKLFLIRLFNKGINNLYKKL